MIGTKHKEKKLSLYNPPEEIKDLTIQVRDDYALGYDNFHKSYAEFNDMSVCMRMDKDQKAFNSYVYPPSLDPDEEWKYRGVRPLVRNAVMVMAAQMTARILFPDVFAQNDSDETDRLWGVWMRDLVMWHIENSNYEKAFLFGVIAALVNPVSYIEVEFFETMQIIRERLANGELKITEAIDEVFSGLQFHNVPVDEIYIANPYGGTNIQRQRYYTRRRYIDVTEANSMYGNHPYFKEFVEMGIRVFYNDEDGQFYKQKDDSNPTLVEEITYKNRMDDVEITFVNGIYMGDIENVENNPIRHRDNQNKPWYNLVAFGFSPIDEGNFFYYKSLAFSLENEQELSNILLRTTVDGTILNLMPPVAVSGGLAGEDDLTSSVIFPASVTFFERDTKINPIKLGNDIQAGYEAMDRAERSAKDSSSADVLDGNLPEASQKAFNVARAETNARIKMSIFGKQIGWAVEQMGNLMIDLILTHQTVGSVDAIVGGVVKMKYKTFNLAEQTDGGRKVTKQLRFTDSLMGVRRTKKEQLQASYRILDEEGKNSENKLKSDTRIVNINVEEFRKLKFKILVEADSFIPRSREFEKATKLRDWQIAIQSPFADREALDRDFLFEQIAEGESDKYMVDQIENIIGDTPEQRDERAAAPVPERSPVGAGDAFVESF